MCGSVLQRKVLNNRLCNCCLIFLISRELNVKYKKICNETTRQFRSAHNKGATTINPPNPLGLTKIKVTTNSDMLLLQIGDWLS